MTKTYNEIVKIINLIGINSTLDSIPVKVVDLWNEVLMLDTVTGWLALRRKLISTNEISGVVKETYFNKVMYKNSTTPYCLKPELESIFKQILNCE